jgi:hypothetical protein
MSERSIDPEPNPEQGLDVDPAGDLPSQADRRSFLRQLSTDAAWTAGKLAGASAALRRGLVAAGESAIGTFEGEARVDALVAQSGPEAPAPAPAMASGGAKAEPVPPAASPAVVADPVAALTPDQHAFLINAAKATLAVNDPTGHPLLAPSIYHWDGALIRLPARDFTARTFAIDRDPKVGIFIDDPASGAWVAIHAIATLVYGEAIEPDMRLILSKYDESVAAAGRLEQPPATSDQLVIRLRPTRFVWRL